MRFILRSKEKKKREKNLGQWRWLVIQTNFRFDGDERVEGGEGAGGVYS